MIKIVFLVSSLRKCGPNKQLIYILTNLDRTKFKPTIISISNRLDPSLEQKIKSLKIKLIVLNKNRFVPFNFLLAAEKVIKPIKPELIHSCGLMADLVSCFLNKKSLSIITTSRNYPLEDYPGKFNSIFGIVIAYLHIFILKKLHL